MSLPVSAIRLPDWPRAVPKLEVETKAASGGGFAAVLNDAIQTVEGFNGRAGHSVEAFLSGENDDLHHTIMEGQRAELAFELLMQVRNKVVQTYQEVMRMQL